MYHSVWDKLSTECVHASSVESSVWQCISILLATAHSSHLLVPYNQRCVGRCHSVQGPVVVPGLLFPIMNVTRIVQL